MDDDIAYVYLLAKDLEGERDAPVKIGVSRRPRARAASIATSCPFPVSIYGTLTAPSLQEAMEWERDLHQSLEEWRLTGEWFSLPPFEALEKILWRLFERFTLSNGMTATAALRYIKAIGT